MQVIPGRATKVKGSGLSKVMIHFVLDMVELSIYMSRISVNLEKKILGSVTLD